MYKLHKFNYKKFTDISIQFSPLLQCHVHFSVFTVYCHLIFLSSIQVKLEKQIKASFLLLLLFFEASHKSETLNFLSDNIWNYNCNSD